MVNQNTNSGVPMKKETLINYLVEDLRETTDRITELEGKESDGTITTSDNNPNEKELDELNELYILKDYYDIELYKGIIDRIANGQFSSANELQAFLRTKISKADHSADNSSLKEDAEIEVQKVPKRHFTEITTLDRMLYAVERLMKE